MTVTCTFCRRPIRRWRTWGMDLLGRTYCRRWRCRVGIRFVKLKRRVAHWLRRAARRLDP